MLSILLGLVPALVCISFHEFCHGYTAYFLGDSTAKQNGRLSFNPVKHLDPMGVLMLLVFRFGWAKPVPVNMYNFRHPKRGMAITALAGPVGNFLLSAVFLLLYGFLYIPLYESSVGSYLLEMLRIASRMSIGLAVFNLLPVPPLDGSKVLFSVIGDKAYYNLMRYERYGTLLMLILIWSGLLGKPLSKLMSFMYDSLFFLAEFGFDLFLKII